jgi:F-type H+-transporting ATPase subunit delta
MLKLQDRPVAARYARALFAAAQSHRVVEPVRVALARLSDVLVASPALNGVLRDPRVTSEVKRDVIQRVFGDFSPVLDRFIGVLLEKKRWDALREIIPVYERLANEAGGILAVRVSTAVALAPEETIRVQRSLEKSWGGPVALRTQVREDLLGGVVLQVGDRVWDNSLKGQMEHLREVWLAGTSL